MQEDLGAVYRKHKKELAQLEDTYSHTDYTARYAALVAENSSLHARVAALETTTQRATALATQQAQVAEATLAMHTESTQRAAALASAEQALAERMAAAEEAQRAAENAATDACRERADLEAAYNELQAAFDAVEAQRDCAVAQCDVLTARLTDAEARAMTAAESEAVIAELQQELARQGEAQVAHFVHDTTVAALEKIQQDELARLGAELQRLQSERDDEAHAMAERARATEQAVMEAEQATAAARADAHAASEVRLRGGTGGMQQKGLNGEGGNRKGRISEIESE